MLVREDNGHVEDTLTYNDEGNEDDWFQLKVFNEKFYNIGSFFVPPNSWNESLNLAYIIGNGMGKYRHAQCIIGGDIHFPGFNWLVEEVLDGSVRENVICL